MKKAILFFLGAGLMVGVGACTPEQMYPNMPVAQPAPPPLLPYAPPVAVSNPVRTYHHRHYVKRHHIYRPRCRCVPEPVAAKTGS